MDHTVLPANNTISAFTPQSQSITVLWPVLITPTDGGMARLSWPGWLVKLRQISRTHPSTNRARRKVTSLIWPTSLPTAPNRTIGPVKHVLFVRIFMVINWYSFARRHYHVMTTEFEEWLINVELLCTTIHSFTRSFVHSPIHSFIHLCTFMRGDIQFMCVSLCLHAMHCSPTDVPFIPALV